MGVDFAARRRQPLIIVAASFFTIFLGLGDQQVTILDLNS